MPQWANALKTVCPALEKERIMHTGFSRGRSACKLNKHGDNIQPGCTPFPIWNQSVVPCPVLTVSS